jgi:N-dimethylarginine dimethylaminohydrolase
MSTTSRRGSEPPLAATHGGPGFVPRRRPHAEELGDLWADCGVSSEVGPLRAVMLAWPGDELGAADNPNENLMIERVDLDRIRNQAEGVAAMYAQLGIKVHIYRPSGSAPPNLIFLRDLFFMTPEGAVVGRTASEQRSGEERFATEALAQAGVPILATVRGHGHFEGADALWVGPRTVFIGIGRRTDRAGAAQMAGVLRDLRVEVRTFEIPDGTQHLLGVISFIDVGLVAVRSSKAGSSLRGALNEHGYRMLDLPDDHETTHRLGMNFVTVRPSEVLMPSRCPGIRRTLEGEGVRVWEVDVGEYVKAAGGVACLSGIVARGPVTTPTASEVTDDGSAS